MLCLWQVRDLLKAPDSRGASTVMLGEPGHGVELVDERIESPSGFARLFKFGSQIRANVDGVKSDRSSRSHLYVLYLTSVCFDLIVSEICN
jgi:hypothetical protein